MRGALTTLLLLVAAAAQGQVYRWIDEQGKVHYGERPPAGAKAAALEDRLATPPGYPAAKNAAATTSQQERDFQRRRIEREQQEARAQQAAAKSKADCDRARSRLAELRAARRIPNGVDDKGDRRWMSDAERTDAIAGQEAAITQACR